jgi:centromere kinetochore component T (CENP-T)
LPSSNSPIMQLTPLFRQRQLNDHSTIFSVAQKFLPAELLQNVKMAPAPKLRGKKRRLETVPEGEEEEEV